MTIQLIERRQQTAQMTIEAINLVYYDNIEFACTGIPKQAFKCRPVATFFGRNPGIHIDLNQLPAMCFGIPGYITILGVQAKTVDLFAHGHAPITYSAQGWRYYLVLHFNLRSSVRYNASVPNGNNKIVVDRMEADMPEEETFANTRRKGLENKYDPTPVVERIYKLLEEHNESYREASLAAGLDHQAIRRILSGQRPTIISCILLANHWGVNPNELILLANWPALGIFNIKTDSADHLPPEAVQVALDIAKISDPNSRKQVAEAIRTLLTKYFD